MLPSDLQSVVIAEMTPMKLPAGAFLYERGAPASGVFRVMKGSVRLFFLTPNGRELVLKLFHPPESVGEVASMDGQRHELFAEAHTDCELLFLPHDKLHMLREKYPAINAILVDVMTRIARSALNFIEEIAVFPLEARVAARICWLVASADARGESVGELRIQQKELGLMVGASRQAVNKALSDLQKMGVLKTSYGAVVITDIEGLRKIGDQSEKKSAEN